MADTIYVVMGTTGEWSERSEWPVAAYTDEKEATKHIKLATERANEEIIKEDAHGYGYKLKNDYDKDMQSDYTGTKYYINEVDLFIDILQYRLES